MAGYTTTTTARGCARSSASSSSTRRTTASTTSTAAGRASAGCARADPAHTTQVNQAGTPYTCLLQNDVNLTSPPLSRDLHGHDDGDAVHEPLHERAVHDRRLHPADATRRARRPACSPPTASSNGTGAARRLHARPRAPLLPGAVPARRRQAESLRDRQRRGRPHDGRLRHARAADLQVPARARATALCDRRQLLPGGVRRLVPQPPVADRRGDAGVAERASTTAAPTTCTPCVDANGMPNTLPAVHVADSARRSRTGADRLVQPGRPRPDAGRRDLRRLRRQHDPARLPALRAGHGGDAAAAAADGADDRRPAERKGVDWAWYSGGWSNADGDVGAPGWTNGTAPGRARDPNQARPARDYPTARTSCSSSTTRP